MNLLTYGKKYNITISELKECFSESVHHMKSLTDEQIEKLDTTLDLKTVPTVTPQDGRPEWCTDQQWRVYGNTVSDICKR